MGTSSWGSSYGTAAPPSFPKVVPRLGHQVWCFITNVPQHGPQEDVPISVDAWASEKSSSLCYYLI